MRNCAAVLCRDNRSRQVLQVALTELGMEPMGCSGTQQALELVIAGRCSALIVDFDLPGAQEVIRMASLLPPEQKPELLAVASRAWPGTGQAFQSGASRILYRPLTSEQLKDALRSGRKNGIEQRKSARCEMKTLVYLDLESSTIPAITIDISEHGLAVQAAEPVPISSNLHFRCVLPGTEFTFQGQADVIWASDQGRAGLFFAKLAPAARKHLKQWLHRRSVHDKARNGKPDQHSVRELLPPKNMQVSFAASK